MDILPQTAYSDSRTSYPDIMPKDVDLNDPNQAIEYWSKEIRAGECMKNIYYNFRAEAYLKKGDLESALSDMSKTLDLGGFGYEDYYILWQIYDKMSDSSKAKWYHFKARHAAAFDHYSNEQAMRYRKAKKERIDEKQLIINEKISIQKNGEKIILCFTAPYKNNFTEDGPIEPEILYSGGENALFRRRPDQFILLENVPDDFFNDTDVRNAIFNKKEALISEQTTSSNSAREYTVKIRLVIEKLDSVESIIKDGYPIYTSLRARVCANMDKPIADLIGKEDYINLAAVLAREENYTLFKKYFEEKLPINGRVSYVFKRWQPTPFFYVTIKKMVGFLEDPLKIIKYLAANGADPNMPCEEGDTPLGGQCTGKGLSIIIKTLLETGADPNCFTKINNGLIKPLHLLLLPSEYDEDADEFTPINSSELEKIKLLVNAGAEINHISDSGITALSLAINNSEGKTRIALIKLLLEKGADEASAIEALKKGAQMEHPKSAFTLYEIYSGRIEGLSVKQDSNLARKYLCMSAELMNKSADELA